MSAQAGLAGVSAGETAISTVGKGHGLSYRGYRIDDLAESGTFEEVAYLLIEGRLPNAIELPAYQDLMQRYRQYHPVALETLEKIPSEAHPMDVLRTTVSLLGSLTPENDPIQGKNIATELLATLPGYLCYWYHISQSGKKIDLNTADSSIAGNFLTLLRQDTVSEREKRIMDASLTLYAEHEFNASTFTARVCAATLSDFHSCLTGAIGSLKGPLHGGANEMAMALIQDFQSPDEAEAGILKRLAAKEKIMGFGHRVYTDSDPRSDIIQVYAKELSQQVGDTTLYPIAERIEAVMRREKGLFPNLDFYSALVYHFLKIETPLFTPIFVLSRLSGWSAHILEQRKNNRLIRPSADYVGPENRSFPVLSAR